MSTTLPESVESYATIPPELKALPQWVCWKGVDRVDRRSEEVVGLNKVPIDPKTNPPRHAKSNDSATWGTFQQCVETLPHLLEQWQREDPPGYRGGGIGFVFTPEDPFAGIDLDHCREHESGAIAPWAQQILIRCASYAEVSPSGAGVKLFVQGQLPGGGVNKYFIELYDQGRFFTVTGQHIPDTPCTIQDCQAVLTDLYAVHAVFDKALSRYLGM
jgi:primase-polymerase (primpol)-like protein